MLNVAFKKGKLNRKIPFQPLLLLVAREGVEANIECLKSIKEWVMETALPLLLTDPNKAKSDFQTLVAPFFDRSPSLKVVLEDVGITIEAVDFGQLGAKLREALEGQEAILKDLGPTKRRRGRPFGSKNLEKKEPGSRCKNGSRKGQKRAVEADNQPDATAEEDLVLTPERSAKKLRRGNSSFGPQSTDTFADLEEKKSNRTTSITLYQKCKIVRKALALHEEQSHHCIEKEIMAMYPKIFYSSETDSWKTGLLNKWIQCLGNTFSASCICWPKKDRLFSH